MRLALLLWTVAAPAALLAQTAGTSALRARGYAVLPEPRNVQLDPGDFSFGPQWRIESGATAEIDVLREELQERFKLRLASGGQGGVLRMAIVPGSVPAGEKPEAAEQAYRLDLSPRVIEIRANAATGLFYGIETLVQLLRKNNGQLQLPEGRIVDWPDLPFRAIYWDDAHHLDRPEYLKRAMRTAAFFKINAFALKLEGHFQYRSAPALVEPYAFSPAELRELTAYGLRYHIQLVPFLDGPGHIAFILKHPEYARLREYPESNYQLCATNPDSYKLLEGMYQDLLDANPGVKYFYLSTDEPYYVGLANNSQCHEADRARELGSVGKLLAEFLDRAAGYLHDRGRTVIFWGEHPLKPADVPFLPSYLVNGELNDQTFNAAFKARGIRQTIYVSTQGEERMFPDYAILPAAEKLHRGRAGMPRVPDAIHKITADPALQDADVFGTVVAAWADAGLHTETFWLGYAAISAAAWNPAAGDSSNAFYPLFYGRTAVRMDRVYQLMSRQAQFYTDTWDTGPSKAPKPILGNSQGMFDKPRPANDQSVPLPPPSGDSTWTRDNARRLEVAAAAMLENRELFGLLDENLGRVEFNRYNLEVFRSIALLCRQNLELLSSLGIIDKLLRDGTPAGIDKALQKAREIRDARNAAWSQATEVWGRSWYPRVAEANGRRFLHELDDIKDHVPDRTVDMSYLIYRELLLPFDEWAEQVRPGSRLEWKQLPRVR